MNEDPCRSLTISSRRRRPAHCARDGVLALSIAALGFAALCANAETWTAGGGTNLSWSLPANWGGSAPANPSFNIMNFNDAGGTNAPDLATVVLDQDWTVRGLSFWYWVGDRYFNFDLGGRTLTLNGGDFNPHWTWNWDSQAGDISIAMTNGVLSFTNGARIVMDPSSYYGHQYSITVRGTVDGADLGEVQVAYNGAAEGDVLCILDLGSASLRAFRVGGKVTIGADNGRGVMYLGAGDAYFDSLDMSRGLLAGNLLQLSGTSLTIGNEEGDAFDIAAGYAGIVLDFNNRATRLCVYGDSAGTAGPATNIPAYVADGRISFLPATAAISNGVYVYYDGTNTVMQITPRIDNDGGASNVTASSASLNGFLYTTNGALTAVAVCWGTADGGPSCGGWRYTNWFGPRPAGPLSTNVTGLVPGKYWYRYWASNIYGEAWAPAASSFETVSAPAIDNDGGASQVIGTQAIFNGALTDGGEALVTIYWGISDGGSSRTAWARTNSLGLLSEGVFKSFVAGLTSGVKYYYRCYATNGAGSAWAPATTNLTALDVPGPGRTWTGGGGTTDDWTLASNWEGSEIPGRPATSVVVFASNDVGNVNRLDADWTLLGGLAVACPTNSHTTDLGGNTLALDGGTLEVGAPLGKTLMAFSNGVLRLGNTQAVNIAVGCADGGEAALTIASGLDANLLGDVAIACAPSTNNVTGMLDLRNSVPAQRVLKCRTLAVGTGNDAGGFGSAYLCDTGGVITSIQADSLYFGNGVFEMNGGIALTVGSATNHGNLTVGQSRNGGAATLAPTGPFTLHAVDVTVGCNYNGVPISGALDLRNAVPASRSFACRALRIGSDGTNSTGYGELYLNDAGGVITNLQVRDLYFGNGILALNNGAAVSIGSSTNPANITVGESLYSCSAAFAPSGPFSACLDTTVVGRASAQWPAIGVFDLTNATATVPVLRCGRMDVGVPGPASGAWGKGSVYLNDKAGAIADVQIESLRFGNGVLTLNSGASVSIGSASNRGDCIVGWGWNGASAAFAASGNVEAHLHEFTVGRSASASTACIVSGRVDLAGAVLRDFDVAGTATIGETNLAKGIVYMGRGRVSVANLLVGVGGSTGSMLRLSGTTFRVGNSDTNVFYIGNNAGKIYLNMDDYDADFAVYGDYRATGPATHLIPYLADGRIVVENNYLIEVWFDGVYSHISRNPGGLFRVN